MQKLRKKKIRKFIPKEKKISLSKLEKKLKSI